MKKKSNFPRADYDELPEGAEMFGRPKGKGQSVPILMIIKRMTKMKDEEEEDEDDEEEKKKALRTPRVLILERKK